MPRKPGILNVRDHLQHEVKVLYAMADLDQSKPVPPIYWDEIAKLRLIAKSILRKANAKRPSNRHDIYVESAQ